MNRIYTISSLKIKKPITLFLISDLHYFTSKDIKKYQFILTSIKAKKPDYVCVTGDILDSADVFDTDKILGFFRDCSKYSKVMLVLGNHDVTIGDKYKVLYKKPEFFEKLSHIPNLNILDNKMVEENDICFYGVEYPLSFYYDGKEKEFDYNSFFPVWDSRKKDKFQLLLIHTSTEIIDRFSSIPFVNKMDLVVSGHTHNGMVPKILEPLFRNNGLISPGKKWFPKNVRGKLTKKNTTFIISGGVTKLSKRSHLEKIDFLWKHEITEIYLVPEKFQE